MSVYIMPRRKDIRHELRAAAHLSGTGYKVVYKQFEIHHSTVKRIVYKLKAFVKVVHIPRSWGSSKFNPRPKDSMLRYRKKPLKSYMMCTIGLCMYIKCLREGWLGKSSPIQKGYVSMNMSYDWTWTNHKILEQYPLNRWDQGGETYKR